MARISQDILMLVQERERFRGTRKPKDWKVYCRSSCRESYRDRA